MAGAAGEGRRAEQGEGNVDEEVDAVDLGVDDEADGDGGRVGVERGGAAAAERRAGRAVRGLGDCGDPLVNEEESEVDDEGVV